MPPWFRTFAAAFVLTNAISPASGQSFREQYQVGGPGMGGYRHGTGSIPFGSVGGGFYLPNSPYIPNQFSAWNPYLPSELGMRRLPGQEGPGGMRLPAPNHARPSNSTTPPRQINSTRSEELVELGDRAFRGGNYKRAAERYRLATKSDIESPIPHIHLAQIAIFHGDYGEAADRLRDAMTAPQNARWLSNAPDIQAMYGEPGEFASQVARLESYLQTHPDDRNAWFVLGAQNYFSGHPQLASDAFLRLTDRRPDQALSAFMDATSLALNRSRPPE